MTTPKQLPVRPSLESLRKQASRLARDVAAGDADALVRVRAQLSDERIPLSDRPMRLARREAQLVVAREYGYSGWQDLTAEVLKRLGLGLEWGAAQAERLIHDSDVAGLKALLAEYPALLTWRSEHGGLLAAAARSFGDSFDEFREQHFTRRECAELLIDAGAIVDAGVGEHLIRARARGMLHLLWNRRLLPGTLKVFTALGAMDRARACLDSGHADIATLNDAFICACRFENAPIASLLLDRCVTLDRDLAARLDRRGGREKFIERVIELCPQDLTTLASHGQPATAWQAFILAEALRTIESDDLQSFTALLRHEQWLLDDARVPFQVELIERATLKGRAPFITQLLEAGPALARSKPMPASQALEFAFTYANTHLVPLLTPLWPLPDDLPHLAGSGDFDRVRRWFDAEGRPALGDPASHTPGYDPAARLNLHWGPPNVQQVLDTAFAWACLNRHFDIADFLLAHGADIDTDWSSHEPASILHELAFHDNYEAMQFLIDRGIDMTIVDYRWGGTAEGWARYAAKDEKKADWLAAQAQQRSGR